jgi:hypothetical protein
MQFEDLLRSFLANDNTIRRNAEAQIEQLRAHKDELPLELVKVSMSRVTISTRTTHCAQLQVLRTSQDTALRSLAAVLLRKVVCVESNDVTHWSTLTPQAQAVIKRQLLEAITAEPVTFVRHRLCDTMTEVAVMALPDYAEMWTFIHASATSPSADHQESALICVGYLVYQILEHQAGQLPHFQTVLLQRLTDPTATLTVKERAAQAVAEFLSALADTDAEIDRARAHADSFAPLMGPILAALASALAEVERTKAHAVVESGVEIALVLDRVATHYPALLKPLLGDLLRLCCAAAANRTIDVQLRHQCLEVVLTLGERAAGMVRY